jgi:transposase
MIETKKIIRKIMEFLELFMCKTLVKRIMSMVLIALEIPNSRITEITGLCDKSVRDLKKAVKNGEVEGLFKVRGGGRKAKVKDVEAAVIEEINTNKYHTRQQIADMIEEKYGIKISINAVGRLLKKNGIKRLKSGSLPSKADVAEQRKFFGEILQPLMKSAKNNEIVLLFADASHFVMGCDFLGYIYGKMRRFIKTGSGRKRYNVLGALNFVSKKITTVTNDAYITSSEVCELLHKISLEYCGKPIRLVLDNAKYQKCFIVQNTAALLGIELVYIPPYSPNLNLIERAWKWVKSELRTKYYDDFNAFKQKIDSIVGSAGKESKKHMDTLITDKVQLFDECFPCIDTLSVPLDSSSVSAA